MMAFTIWQPWASLIAAGAKPYEFRKWPAPPHVRGKRVAIHAGARKVKREEIQDLLLRTRDDDSGLVADVALPLLERWLSAPGSLPLSSVLCTAVMGDPIKCIDRPELFGGDSTRIDHHIWAWPLTDIERLEPFVPARGAQGFWPWP